MGKTLIKETIHAKGIEIGIYTTDFKNEYISLTDIAKYRSSEPRITIHNWLRGRDIVEFLGLWEALHNPDFKRIDFETFKENAGTNAFVFSIKKWNEDLGAIGLLTKSGRYGGGIYAHMDIALEFASWLSPEFKLYIIKDYKRLKYNENSHLSIGWNLNREIAKLNYHIHTDAIKSNLIPPDLTQEQIGYTYATLNQLLVLANMESYNAILIEQGKQQSERLILLHDLAVRQMQIMGSLNTSRLPQMGTDE